MASEKISQLTPHPASVDDILPVEDGGANFSDSVGDIVNLAEAACLPLAGGTMVGVITGNASFTDPNIGPMTEGLSLLSTSGMQFNMGLNDGNSWLDITTPSFNTSLYFNDSQGINFLAEGGAYASISMVAAYSFVVSVGSSEISLATTGCSYEVNGPAYLRNKTTNCGLFLDGSGDVGITDGFEIDSDYEVCWIYGSAAGGININDTYAGIFITETGAGGINLSGGTGGIVFVPTTPPTSAATAGTQGQILAGTDGNLYFCSVTGGIGEATWNVLSMTAV